MDEPPALMIKLLKGSFTKYYAKSSNISKVAESYSSDVLRFGIEQYKKQKERERNYPLLKKVFNFAFNRKGAISFSQYNVYRKELEHRLEKVD